MTGSFVEKGDYKVEATWMFGEEEVAKIRQSEKANENCKLYSRSFGNAAWRLRFDSKADDDGRPSVYLFPQILCSDVRQASSTVAWARSGTFRFDIVLMTPPSVVPEPDHDDLTMEEAFAANLMNSGIGWRTPLRKMLLYYDSYKFLGFKCTVTGDHFPPSTPVASSLSSPLSLFFDNVDYADTVFVVHLPERKQPLHIFACKAILTSTCSHFETLFDSGFSESTAQRSLDVKTLKTSDPLKFRYDTVAKELLPFYDVNSARDGDDPAEVDETEAAPETAPTAVSNGRGKKRARIEEETNDNVNGKMFTVIDIHETDFVTYRAMIAYLHTNLVPFTSIPSNFLVELAKGSEGSTHGHELFPADWFSKQFNALEDQPKWNDVQPCSSHAMYRLADCYAIDDLRDWSLGFILRSLTTENVAYELFSPLSLDYEAVSQPILDFIVKHWAQVKETKAFEIVLDKFATGELSKGRDLMAKLMKASRG